MPNMKKWYVEDTASSALGRAIILLKGSNKTATKDDMKRVETSEPNQYEKKLQERRYGAPGTKSAAIEDAWSSMRYTMMSSKNPQVWTYSNAGDQHSVILNKLRERGLAASMNPSDTIGWFEWSAEPESPITLPSGCLSHRSQR